MSAVLSTCMKYRYRLERDVQPEGMVAGFFGINPSTADATVDDATVRKWRGFSERNQIRRFVVGNVFAYRSTDVHALKTVNDPVGLNNQYHIERIIRNSDILVPCFGAIGKVPVELLPSMERFLRSLQDSGKPILTFGFTQDGSPKHPLMLPYTTKLVPWPGLEKFINQVWEKSATGRKIKV